MVFKILGFLLSTTAFAQNTLRTTDFQQSLNANAPRNYMLNGGFEKNEVGVTDTSSIAARVTTTPLEGDAELNINATATAQIVYLEADPVQPGLDGQSCEAIFTYTGDATLYEAYVFDGSSIISDTVTLQNVGTNSQTVSLIFACQDSVSVFVAIESTGDGASINIDSVYVGKPVGLGSVAQAQSIVNATRITTAQTISSAAETQVAFNSAPLDVFGEVNTSTGTYTSKATRSLIVTTSLDVGGFAVDELLVVRIKKNSSEVCLGYLAGQPAGPTNPRAPSCQVNVVPGDTITVTADSVADTSYTIGNTTGTYLTIQSFPSATERIVRGNVTNVAVEASGTPTGSLSAASATIWGTEARDTAGAYNTTTGEFTAPITGDYCYNAAVGVSATYSAGNILAVIPYINGVAVVGDGLFRFVGASTNSVQAQANGCTFLNRGDILTFRTTTNGTTPAFVAANTNYLKIHNASGGAPKPFIPSSVFAGRAAVSKIGIAVLNCTATSSIGNNYDGMIATLGNRSTATCAFTFTAGFWSQAPDCTTSSGTTAARTTAATSVTTSGGNVLGYTDAGVGDNTTINLFCVGQ